LMEGGDPLHFCAIRMLQVKQCHKPPSPPMRLFDRVVADVPCHYDVPTQCVSLERRRRLPSLLVAARRQRSRALMARQSVPVFAMRLGVTACAFSSSAPAQFLVRAQRAAELANSGLVIKSSRGDERLSIPDHISGDLIRRRGHAEANRLSVLPVAYAHLQAYEARHRRAQAGPA
jgi:hypothetical protein